MKSATPTRHLKVDISLYIDMFFMSVNQVYAEFRAQVYRDRDRRKRIQFSFIILQKDNVLLLLWVNTNKRKVFTDSKDALLLSVWLKLGIILRASERTGTSICPVVSATVQFPHPTQTQDFFTKKIL